MSDHTLIAGASETLAARLAAAITHSAAPPLQGSPIDLRSPREVRAGYQSLPGPVVSLWLYRAVPNHALATRRPVGFGQAPGDASALTPDLFYLVTPMALNPVDTHTLLGAVLAGLQARPVLSGDDLRGSLAGRAGQLRLGLDPLSLEDARALWSALQEPYQLSVSYHVQLVGL